MPHLLVSTDELIFDCCIAARIGFAAWIGFAARIYIGFAARIGFAAETGLY